MRQLIQHIRRAAVVGSGAGLTDGQMLECFLTRRDEAAFEALVRLHGPMVLGVCRRVLGNFHDAEDAFQATFLVLVRRAASIVPREMVGNWLYGAAVRTALKAKAAATRRRAKERPVAVLPDPEAGPADLWRELRSVLDQELSRLPDKQRLPVVLCDLEGKTHKEAARLLGWPEGTLSVRLMRARALLAKRLARHSLTLSGASLAVLLSEEAASAGVPASLAGSTVKAATLLAAGQAAGVISAEVALLTEGVLKAMLLTKLTKVAAVVLLALVIATGTGLVLSSLRANDTDAQEKKAVAPAQGKEDLVTATASEVLGAYEYNQARADEKYTGKQIRVSGTLAMIKRRDQSEKPAYLVFLNMGRRATLQIPLAFEFKNETRQQLAALQLYSRLTIEGKCLGVTPAVTGKDIIYVRDCKILEIKPPNPANVPFGDAPAIR